MKNIVSSNVYNNKILLQEKYQQLQQLFFKRTLILTFMTKSLTNNASRSRINFIQRWTNDWHTNTKHGGPINVFTFSIATCINNIFHRNSNSNSINLSIFSSTIVQRCAIVNFGTRKTYNTVYNAKKRGSQFHKCN